MMILLSRLWLSWKRYFDIVAPKDGRCSWKKTTHYHNFVGRLYIEQEEITMRCVYPWGHKGKHHAEPI